MMIALLCGGCGASKLSQCQQIYGVVNQLSQETKALTLLDTPELNLEQFQEALDSFQASSTTMKELNLKDETLIELQGKFVEVYRQYGEATAEMIQAREELNRELAETAIAKVTTASELEQATGDKLQSYCQ